MAYTPTVWKDGQAPALNAENLNKMEQGIAGAWGALSPRNCQWYTASYVGDGSATKTWTFPAKPVLVHLIGDRHSIMFRSAPVGMTQSGQTTSFLQVTWGENSVTWTNANNSAGISNNSSGDSYGIFAILDAGNE